jgi:hypothetical protein
MARRKAMWSEGSVFLVPQPDGLCSVSVRFWKRTPEALNSAVCAFYEIRVKPGAGSSTGHRDEGRSSKHEWLRECKPFL